MEPVWKILVTLIFGAFGIGGWVATIQYTVNAHSKTIGEVSHDQRDQERKYIDVLGRIDERLKNIETKTK